MNREAIDALLSAFTRVGNDSGNARVTAIVNRIVKDLFYTIEDFDIQPAEFWHALDYLAQAGRSNEFGLIAAGLGFEHFLDLRLDEAEVKAGLEGGTPRTIEGPLYIAGAPESVGQARLDDGTEEGEILFMQGTVFGANGQPLPNALVEVWHANRLGNYSFFDSTQSDFNLRRSIRTDADGRYRFRSIMPVGYSVPPGGPTEQLLQQLGRHGTRPAHIHFFISAQGYRKLTTQINIDGDPYLWDDFAFATREGLVPKITRFDDAKSMDQHGVEVPFASIDFDFRLHPQNDKAPTSEIVRSRAGT